VCIDATGGVLCNGDTCVGPGVVADQACTFYGTPGACVDYGGGFYCDTNPCSFLNEGDVCTAGEVVGVCVPDPFLGLTCYDDPCEGLALGDACVDAEGPGTCTYASLLERTLCAGPDSCTAAQAGDECTMNNSPGTCQLSTDGMICVTTCVDDYYGCSSLEGPGYCFQGACLVYNTCTAPGGYCGYSGECVSDGDGFACTDPMVPLIQACTGVDNGFTCTFDGSPGVCVNGICDAVGPMLTACEGLTDGNDCAFAMPGDVTSPGSCAPSDLGLLCELNVCSLKDSGDYCYDGAQSGFCLDDGTGRLECRDPYAPLSAPCQGAFDGDACGFDEGGQSFTGTCQYSMFAFWCESPDWLAQPCQGLQQNDACTLSYEGAVVYDATCILGDDGSTLVCADSGVGSPGGIDGLGVDTCGNVYASEYIHGNVYRISAAGEIEQIADVPSSWIPNIKWGRDAGGFGRNVMYIADRDQQSLFAVEVGVPGATEFYDVVDP
jgi:hypothetical protein